MELCLLAWSSAGDMSVLLLTLVGAWSGPLWVACMRAHGAVCIGCQNNWGNKCGRMGYILKGMKEKNGYFKACPSAVGSFFAPMVYYFSFIFCFLVQSLDWDFSQQGLCAHVYLCSVCNSRALMSDRTWEYYVIWLTYCKSSQLKEVTFVFLVNSYMSEWMLIFY